MNRTIYIWMTLAGWSAGLSAGAVTVAALQGEMAAGAKVTVIDVRDSMEYGEAHIPGAINVPASLCSRKHLPPLGRVVIYDDGLGRRGTAGLNGAASALAAKPGLTVEILEGGFAAWETGAGLTTRGRGLKPETFNYLTYPELKAAGAEKVVLVDLRKVNKAVLKLSGGLTDLQEEFPGRRVVTAAPEPGGANPLVVLIDSGDGSAEAAARALKARGVRGYAILAGGELAIARKGRAGLERSSPGNGGAVRNSNPAPAGPSTP